jgi:hypothetical protein
VRTKLQSQRQQGTNHVINLDVILQWWVRMWNGFKRLSILDDGRFLQTRQESSVFRKSRGRSTSTEQLSARTTMDELSRCKVMSNTPDVTICSYIK